MEANKQERTDTDFQKILSFLKFKSNSQMWKFPQGLSLVTIFILANDLFLLFVFSFPSILPDLSKSVYSSIRHCLHSLTCYFSFHSLFLQTVFLYLSPNPGLIDCLCFIMETASYFPFFKQFLCLASPYSTHLPTPHFTTVRHHPMLDPD